MRGECEVAIYIDVAAAIKGITSNTGILFHLKYKRYFALLVRIFF